jgi:hypothetical protein
MNIFNMGGMNTLVKSLMEISCMCRSRAVTEDQLRKRIDDHNAYCSKLGRKDMGIDDEELEIFLEFLR